MLSTGSLVSDFIAILTSLWRLIANGGWVAIVWAVVYMFWYYYKEEVQLQFRLSQDWTFLHIRVPKENERSLLGVEQIFSQLHQLHLNFTFAEKYIEGKIQLWYSLEIVSLGGKISFIMRIPKKQRVTVESAIYGQFPAAEITEVEDYLKNVAFDPQTSEFDLFGFEYKVLENQAIPIKTYKEFEHQTAEQKIIDPLAGLFEALAQIEPDEFYGVQILIQPLDDKEWKDKGEMLVKKLIGEEVPLEFSLKRLLLAPFELVANFKWTFLLEGANGHAAKESQQKDPFGKNNWMRMTDVEKERVNAIQRKLGKPGYKTKIRNLYIAPKGKLDLNKRSGVIGALRPFKSQQLNGFKPDLKHTWTKLNYAISPTLEKPYIDWEVRRRKRWVFNAYKDRSVWIGLPASVMNIEELATIYHFPLSEPEKPTAAPVEAIESKKSQAPVNLPVG